ncbi:DNA-directed RNA polymerase subunit L [Nanobdella aerobiophila]|uniref:DNA-directed RNA polymerase subunit Rpo11 n=1 Tax=Nanobdella aerobiophila TaxID=2586965 RepID=A0A915SZD9_9ARCH|nr:RpoL/Rpb11 RNA polymerase subunit family protein [Nanobdella aerobiophila]BBL45184.1 DNA-directed RNA polymerase subunit L [Nanobdella aerobiophila]
MKIIKENDEEMEIVFENDRPTVYILIKEELDKDKNVIISAWKEDHPLLKNISLYIKTDKNEKPRNALINATKRAIERVNNFSKEYNKIINEIR